MLNDLVIERKHKDSLGEEVWSRGSLTDECEYQPTPNLFISLSDILRRKPTLFRYELGGIVVYDSKAHIAGDPKPKSDPFENKFIPMLPSTIKKLLTNADPRGNR